MAHFYAIWGANIFETFCDTFILPKTQNAIVDYLNDKCAQIDTVISEKQKQLSTLDAYKKSLIYEYVTGKKEVPVS